QTPHPKNRLVVRTLVLLLNFLTQFLTNQFSKKQLTQYRINIKKSPTNQKYSVIKTALMP
ncbi:hypothetical protein, partial [Microcoleus sp. herbarium12]|uniref:hypothetical protein n=1 Tax=Microcoleus sp. herbarium12 TaxID=3055437 RepID=UPI002FD66914